ncbi:MAG: hypothetical protein QM769_01855 [Pseudoxanthomonas sp.]
MAAPSVNTESVASRIEHASNSIDGAAAFLMDLVQSSDAQISRMAYALGDLLERISNDLDGMVEEIKQAARKGGEA